MTGFMLSYLFVVKQMLSKGKWKNPLYVRLISPLDDLNFMKTLLSNADDLSFLKTLAVGSSAELIKNLRMESASDYLCVAMFRLRNADDLSFLKTPWLLESKAELIKENSEWKASMTISGWQCFD
nr:hypothetical protein CFP56_55287 [Quercus suber]